MAVTYRTDVKNTRLQAAIDAIDIRSGPGRLVIGTSALSGGTGVLATLVLDDPCAPAPTDGVLTFSGMPLSATAAGTGTAANAELRDSDGNWVVKDLTVTAVDGGGDIEINSTSITASQTVQVTSAVITHG